MDSFVTDTQALVKFMMGKKVIDDRSHQAYQSADRGESTIIIPAIVLMEMLYSGLRGLALTNGKQASFNRLLIFAKPDEILVLNWRAPLLPNKGYTPCWVLNERLKFILTDQRGYDPGAFCGFKGCSPD